jgi:hypothetical protein
MTPEESVIHSSSLTKFRKLRLCDTDLLDLLIEKTVSIALEKGIIRSRSIIVDTTHSLSRSNPQSAVEVLRQRSKLLRKIVYSVDESWTKKMPDKTQGNDVEEELQYCHRLEELIESDAVLNAYPAVKEKLNLLKETVEDVRDHFTVSKDPDARVGHKSSDSSFFGFKTHIAMTEERIITAATVTSGEKGDGPQLSKLLEISQKNGIEVDTIIGDSAYSGKENLKLANEQEIKVVSRLNPSITQGFRKEEDSFDYTCTLYEVRSNKDAGMFVCPAGHLAIRKARQGKKNADKNQVDT